LRRLCAWARPARISFRQIALTIRTLTATVFKTSRAVEPTVMTTIASVIRVMANGATARLPITMKIATRSLLLRPMGMAIAIATV
jgi:hypothetical protein